MFETAFVLFNLDGIKLPTEDNFFFSSFSSNVILQEKENKYILASFEKPRMYS